MRDASRGDASAQFALGVTYLEGSSGLPQNQAAALDWLERAARQGVTEAVRLIGERVRPALVLNPARYGAIFRQAAEMGSAGARRALIDWSLAGIDVGVSIEKALEWLEVAADRNDVGAQLRLAYHLWNGPRCDRNPSRALQWFEHAAKGGSVAAQEFLAEHCSSLERSAALHWLTESAIRGEASSCARLGVLLLDAGRVVEAAQWLERAARAEQVEAQVRLGKLYATRGGRRLNGVPHSYKRAAALLDRASEQGSGEASLELWRLYSLRTCSLRDAWTAHRYLERAAQQGQIEAQYLCGKAALRHGSARDEDITAARWLARAAAAGHPGAAALLQRHYPTPAQLLPAHAKALKSVIQATMRVDVETALRLELKLAFGLSLDEALLIDPIFADRGDCLLVSRYPGVPETRRRVILLDSDASRRLIDQAKNVFGRRANVTSDAKETLLRRRNALVKFARTLHVDLRMLEMPERSASDDAYLRE